MADPQPMVFSTSAYEYLAHACCGLGSFEPGEVDRRTFPDGERYLRVRSDVQGRDVVVIGGTITEANTLELYDLACGIVQCGAAMITLAVPYFGYSTMERAVKEGEVVTAKTRARLLSTVPPAYHANRVLLLDIHTEGIACYFEGAVHTVSLSARSIVAESARQLGGESFVIGSTDAGRAKWVQRLANELGMPASFIIKQRLSGDETEVLAASGNVAGQTVIIYDDMIRTGGSLVGAARAYRKAGATTVFAIATHGVLPGDSLERLRDSGLLERVVCTDSHPRVRELAEEGDPFLEVISVAPLIAANIPRRS